MSKDSEGRDHTKPCGDESCGFFDVAKWRAQASREVDACFPLRDKMTAAEKQELDGYAEKLKLGLPDNLPGSVTQAVYVWANIAGDAEKLRLAVAGRQSDTTPSGDDDDKENEGDSDGETNWPTLPDITGNSLAVDAFRGANFGGFMPLIAAAGIACFAIWSKPARALKGRMSK
jgi:hypothetical protein